MTKTIMTMALGAGLAACGGKDATPAQAPETPEAEAEAPREGLQIKLTGVYVDDQDQALAFYTGALGFEVKDDETNGGYRWLTVMAPGDHDGTALQLQLDADPAAKAYQEAMYAQGQPAAMFFTDDLARDHARIEAAGGKFTQPPTDVMYAWIATVDDGVGNLLQLTQLK